MKFDLSRRGTRATLLAASFCLLSGLAPAHAHDAASLRARHAALSQQLASNQFHRPLYLDSTESSGDLKGDVYALVAQPFAVVGPAMRDIDHWCDMLILHLNIKRCVVSTPDDGDTLSLSIGRKFEQPVADAYLFELRYRVAVVEPGYLRVVLSAADGPLGTSRYRIVLEVVELDGGGSFLHLSYAYAQGFAARVATKVYLATLGRSKVGFSIVGSTAGGEPVYIGSSRGVIERNAMRVYLAIEAYLDALAMPVDEQPEQRLVNWYAGAERYPAQLHELERGEYLDMKHREIPHPAVPGAVASGPAQAAGSGTPAGPIRGRGSAR